MSELTERTNQADIAAVTEVVRAYYEGMMAGDEVRLTRAFHPRACIVGNYQAKLEWQTFEEFFAECKEAASDAAGPHEWRIDGLSFQGDTALVRLGDQFAAEWYSDDLSMLRIDGVWRIVHNVVCPSRGDGRAAIGGASASSGTTSTAHSLGGHSRTQCHSRRVAASGCWRRLGRRRLTLFRMSPCWSDLPALCRRRRPRPSSVT